MGYRHKKLNASGRKKEMNVEYLISETFQIFKPKARK
jgi:hypothetical protein